MRKRRRKLLKCRSLDSDFERKGMEGLLVDLILGIKRLLKKSWGVLVLGEGRGAVWRSAGSVVFFPLRDHQLEIFAILSEMDYVTSILFFDRYSVQLT